MLLRVKQSHYRPGQALRVQGVRDAQISRQSAHEGGKVVSPTHRPPLPQEISLVFISDRGGVNSRAIVRPEQLCHHRESTPRPSDLLRSASTNCATAMHCCTFYNLRSIYYTNYS
jgi:hypothetical protein